MTDIAKYKNVKRCDFRATANGKTADNKKALSAVDSILMALRYTRVNSVDMSGYNFDIIHGFYVAAALSPDIVHGFCAKEP